MVEACPNCLRQLREGMNFCPGCGTPLTPGAAPALGLAVAPVAGPVAGPGPMSGREGTLHFIGPAPSAYPFPYMPSPFMPPPPLTATRATAIAAGIMMIVTACFTFIAALLFFFEQWLWSEAWWLLGSIALAAFIVALVGSIGIFRRSWKYLDLAAAILLVIAAIMSAFSDMVGLGTFILILSIVCLVLLVLSWPQFNEPRPYQFGMFPMMPGMPQGAPPPALVMPPPANMGAPPPAYSHPAEHSTGVIDDGAYLVDDFVGSVPP